MSWTAKNTPGPIPRKAHFAPPCTEIMTGRFLYRTAVGLREELFECFFLKSASSVLHLSVDENTPAPFPQKQTPIVPTINAKMPFRTPRPRLRASSFPSPLFTLPDEDTRKRCKPPPTPRTHPGRKHFHSPFPLLKKNVIETPALPS